MKLVDTHCHIHSADYQKNAEEVYATALEADIFKMICVGTDVNDSERAVAFASSHDHAWASVGVHPHEAKDGVEGIESLITQNKVVAVGEIGLDYFYTHSPRDIQIKALERQLQWAQDADKPVIFHVREAYDDFWPALAQFPKVRGVLHSFTDSQKNLEKALGKGLYIGVNGIATFTKDQGQREMLRTIPLESLLLETDAPYLTPAPHRGKVNEPAFVELVAAYMCQMRSISLEELATYTTRNATHLFHI